MNDVTNQSHDVLMCLRISRGKTTLGRRKRRSHIFGISKIKSPLSILLEIGLLQNIKIMEAFFVWGFASYI